MAENVCACVGGGGAGEVWVFLSIQLPTRLAVIKTTR